MLKKNILHVTDVTNSDNRNNIKLITVLLRVPCKNYQNSKVAIAFFFKFHIDN